MPFSKKPPSAVKQPRRSTKKKKSDFEDSGFSEVAPHLGSENLPENPKAHGHPIFSRGVFLTMMIPSSLFVAVDFFG